MKNIFIIALLFFASCKKNELNQNSSKQISVRYVVTANHLPPNATIKRWKQIGNNETDFTDTVSVASNERDIAETIYYAQCPEQVIFGAMILNDTSPADSLYVEIFINGNLISTGVKAGRNLYYDSEITTNINW